VKQLEYSIDYNEFHGPVTLLLESIRKKKIDIYQIRLSDIIQDFLDFIKNNKNIPIDTLSKFLYIITLLLEIKSSSVIPSQNKEQENIEEEADLSQLKQREEVYSVYKKAANYILKRKNLESIYFIRESPVEPGFIELLPDFFMNLNAENINLIASRLLKKDDFAIDLSRVHIDIASITILDAINSIKKMMEKKVEISFKELAGGYDLLIDKIVCFLSILELYKNEIIDIVQFENFGNITIRKAKGFN
jgi:segregation and condensation protein A